MIVKLFPLLLLVLKTSRCSIVIDNDYQKGLYLSDYCPNMQYCREGAHVMCFYNPNNVMGPRCYNAVNVSITADLARLLLEVSNTIRSKLAKGKEKGKDGVLLPRGYGIFRLKWDKELATFAQVLANQCTCRHDMCRATKRFPNPSQTIGLVRFTFPDWKPLSKNVSKNISNTSKLTNAKLVYAITLALKSWYIHKSAVTEQMVKVYPDWTAPPINTAGRLYLDMIYGSATHMGCGIAGYTEYFYYANYSLQGLRNSAQVVCNFSAGARKGTRVYETEPPIPGQGFSARCGCPLGSKEDSDCLCNEAEPLPPVIPEPTCPLGERSSNCDPALVLLPIFTIEDAPPDKLVQITQDIKDPLTNYILQRIDNTTDTVEIQDNFKDLARARTSNEMFDFLNEKDAENAILQHVFEQSSAQSTASPYHKKDNTTDAIFGHTRFKPMARARTSSELLEFIQEKGGEKALNWPYAHKPTSVELPSPSFNELQRGQQSTSQYRFAPDSKPPPLPSPPPRKIPAPRPSPPTRPASRPRPPPPPPPPPRIPPPPPPRVLALQTHVEPRPAKQASQDRRSRPSPKLPPRHGPVKKKSSIFTRVAQFQLPERRITSPFKVVKKDVEPRKDFSNLNKVVNDYLRRHPGYRIINGNNENNKPKKDIKPPAEEKLQTDAVASETGLNKAEETIINFNKYVAQKNNSNFNDEDADIKDDNDNKLLSLLDTLEREVKHIALDGSEKQLFDAKIRKIYGSIVGKTALQKFPKPILFSTPEPEAVEIDFGETKTRDKVEENDTFKILNEPKPRKRFKVDKRTDRAKQSSPLVQGHKWKNKFINSFDQKQYNTDVSSYGDKKSNDNRYDHKYNDKLENTYGDIHHIQMDELDQKYNENMHKKYNENNLDHEYNEVPHKFNDNLDHSRNYDTDRKLYDNEPASRSKIKYNADRGVFREFEHNSLGSQEHVTSRNYKKVNQAPPEIPLISKDREKRKRSERKHRKRVKSLGSRNDDDILSLERRKYYQEKLDNIRRKLRSRRNRNNNDSKNELSLRRMHTKNRDSSRMRSKSQADSFYMPDRARFLHGF